MMKWPLSLAAVLALLAGFCFLSHASVIKSLQTNDQFPCKIVNSTFVDCRSLSLMSIPSGIPPSTETLLLSHNKIHPFTSSSLAGLVNLKYLDISFNSLSNLNRDCFTDQKKLEHLYLSHNQINSIAADTFVSSSALQTLDLSYQNNGLKNALSEYLQRVSGTLTTLLLEKVMIKSAAFYPSLRMKALKVFSLAQNNINGLGPTDFMALSDLQMETFNLSYNSLSYIDTKAFSMILGVKTFSFTGSLSKSSSPPTSLIGNLSLAVSTLEIQTLILRSLGLSSLSSVMFKGLEGSSLKELDLSGNQIATLVDDSFASNIPGLETLQLHDNSIVEISQEALAGLTNLTCLYLNSNLLTEINSGIFNQSTALEKLYLSNNSITTLSPEGSFKGLIHLQVLHIRQNKLKHQFIGGELQELGELIDLDLSDNVKISLTENSFKGLDKLKYLSLKQVHLVRIDATSPFAFLKELRNVDLSNNNMDRLDQDTFLSLKVLEVLYLDHNHLNNMWYQPGAKGPSLFLDSLFSLKTLDLSSNGLQGIPENAFKDLTHLKTLHLSDNKLSVISDDVFDSLKEIEYLDLHKNAINVVNKTMLTPILKTLKILSICVNPFSCGCEQEWFRNWIDSTKVVMVNKTLCLCDSPPDWRKKPLMDFHPEVLNCDGKLLLKYKIAIGVCSFVCFIVIIVVVVNRWKIYYTYIVVTAKYRRSRRKREDYEKIYDFNAFISHSNADKDWVLDVLIPELESGDDAFHLCHHGRNFKPGQNIIDNIIDSVDSSQRTICVISNSYLESNWCSYERKIAMGKLFIDYKDVLILIILEDIPDKKLSKYDLIHRFIKKKTYLKWPGGDSGRDEKAVFWQRLKTVLRDARTPENVEVVT